VCATDVRTGLRRVFENEELSAEVLLASAALPKVYQAVAIDGEHYWDGGYTGNPALAPLYLHTAATDVIVVGINPIVRAEVPRTAHAMPLTNPSFPRGPYRFFDREYLIVTYRTDPAALRAVVPEPLEIVEPVVKYEFIRMPDSTGFGDYTESGQVIPVRHEGRDGLYVHSMYLDAHAPIAAGRELWGFPKKLAQPAIHRDGDVVSGTLHYGRSL